MGKGSELQTIGLASLVCLTVPPDILPKASFVIKKYGLYIEKCPKNKESKQNWSKQAINTLIIEEALRLGAADLSGIH